MNDDRKCAGNTPSETRTRQKAARTRTTRKAKGKGSATPTAKPPVVSSHEKVENPEVLLCPRSLEESLASTSSTSSITQRCPVSGKKIPSLVEIEKKIDKSLTLWNWHWPRSIAVKGIALLLRRWAEEEGLEVAARRGEAIFSSGKPMEYADLSNLPWVPKEDIDQLTPAMFADRIGALVNENERHGPADQNNGDGGQRLLSGARASGEDHRADGDRPEDGGQADNEGGSRGDEGVGEGGRVIAFPTGGVRSGPADGLSRSAVESELKEHEKDLAAFNDAYSCIHKRVQEVKDESQMMKLVNWSGTSAVMGSLEMSIHAIERTVSELRDILRRIDSGVIPDLDGPRTKG
jgi:hypothetical protein